MNGIFLIEIPSFSRHGSLAIKANERKREREQAATTAF